MIIPSNFNDQFRKYFLVRAAGGFRDLGMQPRY